MRIELTEQEVRDIQTAIGRAMTSFEYSKLNMRNSTAYASWEQRRESLNEIDEAREALKNLNRLLKG